MANIDEAFAALSDVQSVSVNENVDFVVDSHLRVISIPVRGVVLGVEGDKDVNRVTFRMSRTYKGIDMSQFQIRINYANANNELNYFKVTEITVGDDEIVFVWVVGADAVAYVGNVEFVVRFIKLSGSNIIQELNTTLATAKSLIGLSVDGEISPVQREDLLAHFYSEIDAYSETKKKEILDSIPEDYTALANEVDELKGDLSEITIKNPSTETLNPTWESGCSYIVNGQIISNTGRNHAKIKCNKGDIYDISLRTANATTVQPIILTKRTFDDIEFDVDTDVIYAKTLPEDLNPYIVTIDITEDCYMYINRSQINTSFPCTIQKTTYSTFLNPNAFLKEDDSLDELNIYKLTNIQGYSDDTVHVIKKTTSVYPIQFDISDVPASNRMMLAYKIKPLFMDSETFNYNLIGNFYRNRNVKTLKRTDVGKELQVYTSLELFGSTDNYIMFGFSLGKSTLQGQSVKSIYTNGIEREFLSDAEDVIRFQVYDVRLIDFAQTKHGFEVSTNYEYQIDDVFAERLIVNESEYVKHERSIHGFGDSLMMSGKYREKSWIENLYLQGYKLNITYDKTNNGHISNKTSNSVYSPTTFTAGFVDKIVKDTVQVGEDITIFALGIHDYSQNTQGTGYCRLGDIGIKESDGNYNWCTVAGAVETILKKVTSNANRRILWVNVAHNKYGIDTDVDYSLREENNMIEQACKNWGVSVSDVYGKMGMNASNVGGNNIWDGQYTDNMKYDESGNLVSDELYFVTSKVAVSDQKRYTTLWVSSGSNGCYMTCFDSNGNFIRNNAPKWSILPSGTTHIVYNVPKASSVEAMTSITNSFTNGFICDVDEAMTTDSVHFTDKSYRRYLQITNEDVKQLILQDE